MSNEMDAIRLMIAEDLDILRNNFIHIVSEQPDMIVVGWANSGEGIIKLRNDVTADVILMDVEMDSKQDGIEAAEAILGTFPQNKIIFLTVHEDDETIFEAFEAGAVDYIIKSSPAEEIIQSIRSAYANNSAIRPEIAYKLRNEFSRIRKNESSFLYVMNIISQLTPSERDVIGLLLHGKRVSEISRLRSVEEVTIKSQITSLLRKFDKRRTKEIVADIRQFNIEHYFVR